MKDLTITIKRQRRELVYLLIAFVLAFAFNVAAIIIYKAPATELITSIFYVLALTVVLYVVWTVLRILAWGIRHLFKSKK